VDDQRKGLAGDLEFENSEFPVRSPTRSSDAAFRLPLPDEVCGPVGPTATVVVDAALS